MSTQDKAAFEAELRAYVGRPVGPPVVGRDPVNLAMIRQWCDAMGEEHPAYLEPDAAGETAHGEIVAPPTMLQAWIMEGWEMHKGYDEPRDEQHRLHKLLTDNGYSGVLGTNTEEHYERYLKIGDIVTAETVIADISEEKATGAGIGYFITTKTTFTDQNDDPLGWMSFRVLKFKPAQDTPAPAEGGEPRGRQHDDQIVWLRWRPLARWHAWRSDDDPDKQVRLFIRSTRAQRAKLLRRICRMQEWPALTVFLRALYTFAPSDDGLLGGELAKSEAAVSYALRHAVGAEQRV